MKAKMRGTQPTELQGGVLKARDKHSNHRITGGCAESKRQTLKPQNYRGGCSESKRQTLKTRRTKHTHERKKEQEQENHAKGVQASTSKEASCCPKTEVVRRETRIERRAVSPGVNKLPRAFSSEARVCGRRWLDGSLARKEWAEECSARHGVGEVDASLSLVARVGRIATDGHAHARGRVESMPAGGKAEVDDGWVGVGITLRTQRSAGAHMVGGGWHAEPRTAIVYHACPLNTMCE